MHTQLATLADIPTIQHLATQVWPDTYREILDEAQTEFMMDMMYSEQALREAMTVKQHRFILARGDDADPIGYAGFQHNYLPGTTKLHKIYLLATQQGTGKGYRLLKAVEALALAAGDQRLRLDVNKYNKAADFYVRAGFTKVDEIVTDIGNGFIMDDFIFERAL